MNLPCVHLPVPRGGMGVFLDWLLAFARLGFLVGLLLGSGCSSDFEPPSLLSDLRVLALLAEPADLLLGDSLTLRPAVFVPPGDGLARQSFRFCPFTAGTASGFRCLDPRCELEWPAAPDGSLQIAVEAGWLQCLSPLSGAALSTLPAETTTLLPTFRYQALTQAGVSREAVLQVPLFLGAPPSHPRNRNPLIAEVLWDGADALAAASFGPVQSPDSVEVRVRVDPASLDAYQGPAGGWQVEEPLVSFYASAGRFQFDSAVGTDVTVRWRAEKLDPGVNQADFYVVVRDLRGGQAVFGPWSVPLAAG